ncbi:hypothetical protein [Candidatus Allofournierella excrementigallinarum]|uniref:hypothetical protein n=1 Tax=Candidatus Allofournierella excrementigallinarum TaxID=2838592 RepID=UPI00374F4C26
MALRRSFCCTGHPTVIPPAAPRGGGAGVPLRRHFPYQGTHEKHDAHLICSGKKEASGIMRGPPLQKSALPSQVDLFLPKTCQKFLHASFSQQKKTVQTVCLHGFCWHGLPKKMFLRRGRITG